MSIAQTAQSKLKMCINLKDLTDNDLNAYSELLWAVPFLNDVGFDLVVKKSGYWNHGFFNKLFFSGQSLIELCDIEYCDYVGVPFKFNPNDNRIIERCREAAKYGKNVIAFYTDDNENKMELPNNLILFRSSVGRSNILEAERVFPALVSDDNIFKSDCNDCIGFCGVFNDNRRNILESIEKVYPVDKIIRSGFWSPEIPKFRSRREFYANMISNKYIFCMRGVGNFSYRFYETLAFGRVPILIDTDTILPLENIIDWDKHIIFIKPHQIDNLPSLINQKIFNLRDNRNLWEEYFSPHGFVKNIQKFI